MENTDNYNQTKPLRALIERIIEKKEITEEEQKEVNNIATASAKMNLEDFDAISKLTEMICSGEVHVS